LNSQAAFTTAPERMQRVHTLVLFLLPPVVTMRTIFKFGSQRLLVLLCAWETLFPTIGPFPHISHTFAIDFSFYPIPSNFHFYQLDS
jgi:hypothetical protein